MNINQRYEALCLELGHLTLEIDTCQRRRKAIMEEMEVLRRLANAIKATPPPPAEPPPTDG